MRTFGVSLKSDLLLCSLALPACMQETGTGPKSILKDRSIVEKVFIEGSLAIAIEDHWIS